MNIYFRLESGVSLNLTYANVFGKSASTIAKILLKFILNVNLCAITVCLTGCNDFLVFSLGIPDLTVVLVHRWEENIRDIHDLDRIPNQDRGLDLVRHIIVTVCICEDEEVVRTTNHGCRITEEDFVRIGEIITITSSIGGTEIITRTTVLISIASTIAIITINTEMIVTIRSKL